MGVEEGLLVGWGWGVGAGGWFSVAWGWVKDADQRLRRREVTMQATGGGEERVVATVSVVASCGESSCTIEGLPIDRQ